MRNKFSIGDTVRIKGGCYSLKSVVYKKLQGKVGVIVDRIPYRDEWFYSIYFPEVPNQSGYPDGHSNPLDSLSFYLWETELEVAN
jgi:hypothetical protein